jgi:hypothetical protein
VLREFDVMQDIAKGVSDGLEGIDRVGRCCETDIGLEVSRLTTSAFSSIGNSAPA